MNIVRATAEYDVPNSEYHKRIAISSSQIKKMRKSVEHFVAAKGDPFIPSDSMLLGSAVHCGILEPDKYETTVKVMPTFNRRTKEGRKDYGAYIAKHEGSIVLTPAQEDEAQRIIKAFNDHPTGKDLISEGDPEVTLTFQDPETLQVCQTRPDWLSVEGKYIVDVKTTSGSADADGFGAEIAKYDYHVSAALYVDSVEAVFGFYPDFYFLTIETKGYAGIGLLKLDEASIEVGRQVYKQCLREYAEYQEGANKFFGYSPEIQPVSLPAWAMKGR